MDCQNHQFFGDFNAVQLCLHFDDKMVLLKLSDRHCSIVIMGNKLKLYCYWYRNNPQKFFAKTLLHSIVAIMDDMKKIKTKIKTHTV